MTAQIKITALTDIGANILGNTLIPVVNMSNVPLTQKATLSNIATHILNQGTGANLGAVGDITITGGSNSYLLSTDGAGNLSWVAGADIGDIGFANNIIFSYDGTYIDNSDYTHGPTASFILPYNGTGNVQVINTYGNIFIQTGSSGTVTNTWSFDSTGNLVLPGNTFAVNYANGTQVSLGGALPTTFSGLPTAAAGLRAFVTDGNLAASGNFGAQVSGGGGNLVPVYSDGTNWFIG